MTFVSSIRHRVLPVLLIAGLTACTQTVKVTPPQVEVTSNQVTHAVVYDNGFVMPSAEELTSLEAFLAPIKPLSVDHVIIERSDTSKLTEKRVHKLEHLLSSRGYPISTIAYASAPGGVSNMLTLHVEYAEANAINCPRWKQNPVSNFGNQDFINLGCTTATNMAVQVAQPRDLVEGHGSVRPDADRNSRAMQLYTMGRVSGGSSGSSSSSGSGATTTTTSSSGGGSATSGQ